MQIRIAGNYILTTDPLVPPANDDIGFGHLQIVLDDGNGTLSEIEVQAPWNVTFGHWFFEEIRDHTHPEHTNYYDQAGYYYSVPVDLGQKDALDVWNILIQTHTAFQNASDGARFEYDLIYNSNTFANTLLSVVGIKIGQYSHLLEGDHIHSYPGRGRNALDDDEYPNDAIDLELIGSDRIDTILTDNGRDLLDGGKGDDTLGDGGRINEAEGSVTDLSDPDTTVDVLIGGDDNDVYMLSNDMEKDIILVGSGFDTIEGGNALDRIILPTSLLTPVDAVNA